MSPSAGISWERKKSSFGSWAQMNSGDVTPITTQRFKLEWKNIEVQKIRIFTFIYNPSNFRHETLCQS